MHVGMSLIFQGSEELSDEDVWARELALGELAEPLGFDSLWGVEHHFTDYTMCPDVLQYLTYLAGRTQHIQLGSMVVVLPWHDPIRVAEQVSMLDVVSGGRFIFGVGRGLGRVEFGGFRVPMEESRARFVEAAEMIMAGLEQGHVKYEGTYYQQPYRELRPRPPRSFRGRTYAAAVSPESSRIMAELGLGILIIPQKPWDAVTEELGAYRTVYRDVNGADAPPTIVAGWVFCDPNEERAREMAHRYIGAYYRSVMRHYELTAGHLTTTKGYEFYGGVTQMLQNYGEDIGIEFFTDLQVWGTPEQCYEKITTIKDMVGSSSFVGVFSYAGMPYDEAERNLRLFAAEVMPGLKKLG